MCKFILLVLLIPFAACAQQKTASAQTLNYSCPSIIDKVKRRIVYTSGEQLPETVEGKQKLITTIMREFKYPKDNYIGTAHIRFIVEANGKLSGLSVLKDPSGKKELFGKPIFKLAKKLNWKPGVCNGKIVPMFYDLMVSCMMPSEY